MKHGGKRNGSGRKKKEPTKVIRIPVSKLKGVYEFIKTGKISTIHPMPKHENRQ